MIHMKIVVLHDMYTNEPIVIRCDNIIILRKLIDEQSEYTSVTVNNIDIVVKETIGEVLNRIKKAESECKE